MITQTTGSLSAQDVFKNTENVANNGYDLVNYFTSHSAERGSKAFSAKHDGVMYYFSTEKNLKAFKENPQKYLPQFGGYCAFGMAKMNQKVPVNPETFRIDDGKLYFFFNDFYEGTPFNTLIPWLSDEAGFEKMAIANWAKKN